MMVYIYNDFEGWWHEAGSGITPDITDDMESHTKRVAQIAWTMGRINMVIESAGKEAAIGCLKEDIKYYKELTQK